MKTHKNSRLTPVTETDEIRRILELSRDASLKFRCLKCNHGTAGIYEDKLLEIRTCPRCHSALVFCPVCRTCTSTTERYKVLICDKCHTNYVTETTVQYLHAREHESAEIVLSGVRATGQMHLGNYFGAIDQFRQLQDGTNFCMFFVADWHTLTTFRSAKEIGFNTIGIAADYLAAGLDPDRSLIYLQSSVPEIAEISLLLSMFQSESQLRNIPTLKDLLKPRKGKEGADLPPEPISMGMLIYPVLMAADILGPQATLIPVGKDQEPNVELAAALAQKINNSLGPTFATPRIRRNPIVPSLTGGKMAKSESDTCILLTDSRLEIERKYRKYGITDVKKTTRGAPGTPENCVSVFPVHALLHGKEAPETLDIAEGCRAGSLGCAECKSRLAKSLDIRFSPFREKRAELEKDRDFVSDVVHFGGLKAREIIAPTLETLREKMGLVSA